MRSTYLMGFDAGGSGARCTLVDVDAGRAVSAYRSWSHRAVPGTGGWGYDFDLRAAERALTEAAREALGLAGASQGEIAGIAATSMRHNLVLLDAAGEALLSVPNRDARSSGEGMELGEQGERYHARTGHWPSPVLMAARLLWFARAHPEAMRRAQVALAINEWVAHWLGGEDASDPSQAVETMLARLQDCAWDAEIVAGLGLPLELLPPIRRTGSRAGTLGREAADALGLRPGIPIAVGGADTQCGLLGIGAIKPGAIGAIAGTTTPVQMVQSSPVVEPSGRLWSGAHVVPGLWVLESNAGSTGEALEWIARLLDPAAPSPVAQLAAEAAASAPAAGGVLSTLGASVMNAREMALPLGNLTMTHLPVGGRAPTRADMARAVFEGLAFGLLANVRQLLSVTGGVIPELRLGGGMARSGLWCQILADALDRPVIVPTTSEASAFGAALCAGVGAGVFGDVSQAAGALVPEGKRYEPAPERAAIYRELWADWERLRQTRAEADGAAAGVVLRVMSAAPEPAASAAPAFRPKMLVTADLDRESIARLRELGEVSDASYRREMRLLSGQDLVDALGGYNVFITEVDVVDAESLAGLPELRVVVSCRGQAVNIDVAACTAHGVLALHAPGRNADAVADLTLGFMLMLLRKLPRAVAFLQEPGGEAGDMARMGQAFQALQGNELWGRTVGLIGMGAVGRKVAERLRPFGARVLGCDPQIPSDEITAAGAEPCSLEDLLRRSDIVSLHAAVTESTRGLLGAKAFSLMKPGVLLVNTARAALLDEAALESALREGRLAGAALDVFAVEPPGADHPLLALPNVIATPHVGGNTAEVSAHQGRIVAEELERLLTGQAPRHALNPEVIAGFDWTTSRRAPTEEMLASLRDGPAPAVRDLEQAPSPVPHSVSASSREAQAARQGDTRPEPHTVPVQGTAARGPGRPPGRLERGLARLKRHSPPPTPEPQPQPSASEGNMENVIRVFLEAAAADGALRSFAASQKLVTQYVLTEPALQFFIAFQDGRVETGLGEPASPADVRLKMKAEIFDKMLSGQINATKAAMTGKLSFSGDTRRAMGMQRIQGDLTRVYNAAREKAGGPGAFIGATATAPAPAAPPVARPGPATPPAQAPAAGDERDELVQVIHELYTTGLITATGGNVSVRIAGRDEIWITPSALFKGDLRPELMVRLDLKGKALDEDARSPSSEWRMHCAVYQARPDVEAVLHAHAPYATTLALAGLPFLPISTEAAFLGEVPCVPFIMPGTQELAEAVALAVAKRPAVLLQNHGILVAASSLRRAADQAEVLERSSQLILGCHAVGKTPPTLPPDVAEMLREAGSMMA